MQVMAEMQTVLNDRLRWPEAVTFEEMNIQNPNELIRIVLKVAHLNKAKAKHPLKGRSSAASLDRMWAEAKA